MNCSFTMSFLALPRSLDGTGDDYPDGAQSGACPLEFRTPKRSESWPC